MCKCSEVFEDKFVQCFDQQEIAMYIKSNGTVKLVHGEVIEMTNFNFCPYCGRNLKPILLNGNDNGAGAMAGALASIPLLKPPEIQTLLAKFRVAAMKEMGAPDTPTKVKEKDLKIIRKIDYLRNNTWRYIKMKEFLFRLLVILLTPIYLIIFISKHILEVVINITEPYAVALQEGVETMTEFWKNILKGGKKDEF